MSTHKPHTCVFPELVDYSGQQIGIYTILRRIKNPQKTTTTSYEVKCICERIRIIVWTSVKAMSKHTYCRCRDNKTPEDICIDQLYQRYKYCTKHRKSTKNLEFSITLEHFKQLVLDNCYYCGKEPNNVITVNKRHKLNYNGLDRLDNDVGYTNNNCKSCCWICNQSKRDRDFQEFNDWITIVYNKLNMETK